MSTPDLIHSATGDRTDDKHLHVVLGPLATTSVGGRLRIAHNPNQHVVLGPLATTSVGGRLRIAHNPNQGSSAVSSEDTQQQTKHLLMGALCEHKRLAPFKG